MQKLLDSFVRMIDEDTLRRILQNQKCDESCQLLHAGDCNVKAIIQFAMGVKSVFKMYLIVHAIPFLLFKLKKAKKNPKEELKKFLLGLMNSLLFAGCSSMIVRRVICLLTKYSSYNWTIARYPASIAGVSIFFESHVRQIEISLYCVAKGWEAAYMMLKRRNCPVNIKCGNLWLNGISLAIITFAFLNQPQVFRGGYKNVLGLFLSDI